MIDEVHMLWRVLLMQCCLRNRQYVKFIFRTTFQKVPVTVLSRCLQLTLQEHDPRWCGFPHERNHEGQGIEAESCGFCVYWPRAPEDRCEMV